jgi:hypothetical protein
MFSENAPNPRLLAKLIRELLAHEKFTSLADLVEALKCRCARLKIRWSNDGLGEALRLVGSNTPLVESDSQALRFHVGRMRTVYASDVTYRPISRGEAGALLRGLLERTNQERT